MTGALPGDAVAGFDGSERGADAVRLGAVLARTTGHRLRVVRVQPLPSEADQRVAAERMSGELEPVLKPLGVRAEAVPVDGGSPARVLQGLAEADDVGVLVVGSTHRAGLGRVLPGSVAERLLSGAPCPVAVAPRGYEPLELRVIAVGYDGSAEATAALELAAAIGKAAAATLRVIAVRRPAPTAAAAQAEAIATAGGSADLQTRLQAAVAALPAELRALPIIERGEPAHHLLTRAEERVDLMLLGSRGYGPVRAVLLGSVSATVVRAAPCPVLVTPRSATGG